MYSEIYMYILVMSAVTIAIRVLPALLLRREIRNVFIRSFLYYVPFVTLAVMTFPYMITATRSTIAGAASFLAAVILSYLGASLFRVAAIASCVVLALEYVLL